MANLYPNYPYGCSDKDIAKAIKEYSDEMLAARADINKVLQFSPLIAVGQNELQSRQTKRITFLSLGIGLLSLVIAGIALWVSFMNTRSNEAWENKQLESLNAIHSDLNAQSKAVLDELKKQELLRAQDAINKTQSNKRLQPTPR